MMGYLWCYLGRLTRQSFNISLTAALHSPSHIHCTVLYQTYPSSHSTIPSKSDITHKQVSQLQKLPKGLRLNLCTRDLTIHPWGKVDLLYTQNNVPSQRDILTNVRYITPRFAEKMSFLFGFCFCSFTYEPYQMPPEQTFMIINIRDKKRTIKNWQITYL